MATLQDTTGHDAAAVVAPSSQDTTGHDAAAAVAPSSQDTTGHGAVSLEGEDPSVTSSVGTPARVTDTAVVTACDQGSVVVQTSA